MADSFSIAPRQQGTAGPPGPDGTDILPGLVIFHAADTPPAGYLKANGAEVSRAVYAALFAEIGTTFGVGDGSTTFALPELRGVMIRGWDDSRGVDSGRVFGSEQTDAFQGHYHSATINGRTTGGAYGGGPYSAADASATVTVTAPTTDGTNGTPRTASETRDGNVALLACIKY